MEILLSLNLDKIAEKPELVREIKRLKENIADIVVFFERIGEDLQRDKIIRAAEVLSEILKPP